jgi:diguanylate cyclase (GGDEF)-like protein
VRRCGAIRGNKNEPEPSSAKAAAVLKDAPDVSNEGTKPRVLLVDDSVVVHRLLQARLKHEEIVLETCQSGAEALDRIKANPPSVILLDLQMPEMDGFEVLRRLKDSATTHALPVIVLSGRTGSEDKVSAFDLGATDYVTKPCDMAELRARLRAALRTERLMSLLSERAEVDGLTGLGNRASFDKRWKEKVSEVIRYKCALSIAMIDADHFKRINDTYGHPAGDQVLQTIGHLLQQECRTADIVCRYGGEEFAVIMPNTAPADAAQVAERIRSAISKVTWPRHPEHAVTVSIGLAGTQASGVSVTAEQWLDLADKNLYTAKHSGRNRVVWNDLTAMLPMQLAKAG